MNSGHAMPMRLRRGYTWARRLAASVLILSLSNLLLGWRLDITLLTRGLDGLVGMVPVTACAFALMGLAGLLGAGAPKRKAASIVLSIGAPVLASLYAWGGGLGGDLPPGSDRLSMASLIILCLLGAGQALGATRRYGSGEMAVILSLSALLIGMGGVTTFVFDATELERYRLFRGLSLPTSVLACLLALSGLFACAHVRIIGTLFAATTGGKLARWFVPFAVLIPLGIALMANVATEYDLLGTKARLAIFSVVLVAVSVGFVLIVAVYQDMVSEREREALGLLERVVQGLDAGLLVVDGEGQTVLSNPQFTSLIGRAAEPGWTEGQSFWSVEDDQEMSGNDHPALLALAGRPVPLVRRDIETGEEQVLQFMAFSAGVGTDGAGRALVVSDMTSPWQLRAAMAQTERLNAVGHLAAGVAHEVTNIFGVIKLAVGAASLIAPTGAPDQYAAILNACRRGGSLADRLQRLSVTASGTPDTINACVTLTRALDLAERGLQPGLRLIRDLPDTALFVACDPMELEMAVLNLVLNARNAITDAGYSEGEIVVTASATDTSFWLSVRDSGPGIPAALLDRVREPFFTTRRATGGTGFGLALIDSFASAVGGGMELSSDPGQGTDVRLHLPLVRVSTTSTEADRPEPINLTGLRILVAEDDPMLRQVLLDALAILGAEIEIANLPEDVPEQILADGPFDVLVTDVLFRSGASGADLAREAQAGQPRLAVIFVTNDREAASQGDLPGALLEKPVHLGVLSHTIAQAVAEGQGRS